MEKDGRQKVVVVEIGWELVRKGGDQAEVVVDPTMMKNSLFYHHRFSHSSSYTDHDLES